MEKFDCIYYDGCSFSTTINGKELVDFSNKEIETILKPILCWLVRNSKEDDARRGDYASLITDKIDFGEFDEGYDDRYMSVYNKARNEDYSIDNLQNEIKKETDLALLQMMFEDLLREFGTYKDFGFCEQCCSYNSEYTYTIMI